MQCSLCFVNNSPRSNQDKGWTCLCDLGYLQQAQPPNYTASNKQCRGCKGRMWGGRGPAWAQEPTMYSPSSEPLMSLGLFVAAAMHAGMALSFWQACSLFPSFMILFCSDSLPLVVHSRRLGMLSSIAVTCFVRLIQYISVVYNKFITKSISQRASFHIIFTYCSVGAVTLTVEFPGKTSCTTKHFLNCYYYWLITDLSSRR